MSQVMTDDTPTPAIGVPAARGGVRGWLGSHRPRGRWLNLLLLLLLVLAVVLAFLVIGNPGTTTTPVRTVAVSRGTVTASVSGSGNAASSVSTPVSFQAGGTVTEIDVKAGDPVTLGEVLAKIDPAAAAASLRTAQAQLENAKAAYAEAADGPTAVKQQQDQLAITQAGQMVTSAETALDQARDQLALDGKSTATAIDNAGTKLSNDRSSTDTSIQTARTTLTEDESTLGRASSQYHVSCRGLTPGKAVTSSSGTSGTTSAGTSGTTLAGEAKSILDGLLGSSSSTTTSTTTSTTAPTASTGSNQSTCNSDYATYKAAAATVARDKLSVTSAEQAQNATIDTDEQAITTAKQDQDQTLTKDRAAITTDGQTVTANRSSVTSSQLTAQADLHPETPDQIAQAKSGIDSAQVGVDTGNLTVAQTTLFAPQAGVVLAVNGKVGESSGTTSSSSTASTTSTSAASSATSSTGFVTIANLSQLAITANIAEADAAKIKLGQAATVTFPATGTTATGSVTQITPQSTVTNNVVLYPVQVSLDTAPAGVGIGSTATLSITTGSVTGVLEAPTAAITTLGNRHTVTVHRGTGTSATDTVVPVQIGLSGDTTTEITSGVSEGDQLALVTASTTGAGAGGGFPRLGGG